MEKWIDFKPAGRAPFAVKVANLKPTDKVLNVGCFNGALERHFLKNHCTEFVGIDVVAPAIEFAKAHCPKGSFLLSPAETLPFENDSFDKVFCLDVLEHVQDEVKTICEIYRVLKPGGALILSVPHDFLNFLDPDELTRGARNFVRKYIKKKPLLNHPKHRHYSEAQLRNILKDFSIDLVHKSGTPVFWTLAMFYTAFGIPEKWTLPFRKLTDPFENFDYALKLPTGFNILVRAIKKA